MEWVSRRLDERDENARNTQDLQNTRGQLFQRLLTRVQAALETYNTRSARPNNEKAQLQVSTVRFGTVDGHGVFQATPGSPSIELNHVLPATITANYSKGQASAVFTIESDENGYLRLKHENQVVSVDKTTEIILSDFLFS
jgi:dihydrodipicolinate reductase